MSAAILVLWADSRAEFEAIPTAIVAALVCRLAMFSAFAATVDPAGVP